MKKGQSLIEVVIGLAVVTILAVGLVTTSLYTQKTSRTAKAQTQATKLAQQHVEQWRIFRDRTSGGFNSLPTTIGCYRLNMPNENDPGGWSAIGSLTPCQSSPTVIVPTSVAPNNAESKTLDNVEFKRWAQFTAIAPSKKTFKVIVTWSDSGGLHSVINDSFLSNWCAGQVVTGGPCASP